MWCKSVVVAIALYVFGIPLSFGVERTVLVLQALTGPGAFVGSPVAEGMKYAADELNARNFLGGDRINVIVVDTASTRAQAMAAISRHAGDSSVLAVLGPTTAVEAIPSAALANEIKIPMMSTTSATGVLRSGPWSFISAQPAEVTMPLLGDFALNRVKVRNCAMIHLSDNEAYVDTARLFRAHAEPRGMKFPDFTGIKTADSDFSAVATRVVAAKPDCVLLFVPAPTAANLAIQLKQAGLDPKVRFLGHTSLASSSLIKVGGAAVEGIMFNADWSPSGSTPLARNFIESYRKAKGVEPDNWNALGHSYMVIMATAIKSAGSDPDRDKVRAALTKSKDIPVVAGNGRYSFDSERVPHYGAQFLVVKDGAFTGVQ